MNSRIIQIVNLYPDLTKILIDFFTAEYTNPLLFDLIKLICVEQSRCFKKIDGETWINSGYLSLFDFSQYMSKKKLNGGGYKIQAAEDLINELTENKIVNSLPEFLRNNQERRYKAAGEFAKFLYDRDLILNLLCGWNYIVKKYSNSVLKIVITNSLGDISIGTGFYFAAANDKINKNIIITNRHVVENASEIKVLTKDDNEIEYLSIKTDPDRDLAFIELKVHLQVPTFHFNTDAEILSEILTMGYPSVPLTKYSYQLFHKGEINTYVEDYFGNKLFLFSAKTSSGNSGSPILDNFGMVVGIVTEELFEEEQFFKKGKLPYYAGIPSLEIINSANDNVFTHESINY